MEPMLMIRTAAVLLTITALGGLALAGVRFARSHDGSELISSQRR